MVLSPLPEDNQLKLTVFQLAMKAVPAVCAVKVLLPVHRQGACSDLVQPGPGHGLGDVQVGHCLLAVAAVNHKVVALHLPGAFLQGELPLVFMDVGHLAGNQAVGLGIGQVVGELGLRVAVAQQHQGVALAREDAVVVFLQHLGPQPCQGPHRPEGC